MRKREGAGKHETPSTMPHRTFKLRGKKKKKNLKINALVQSVFKNITCIFHEE